jgi:ketosteroid isomerase-like protein
MTIMGIIATRVTADDIRAEVNRYWTAFTSKSKQVLEDFYAHESSVFPTSATRSEPGRLTAARRDREYFGPRTTLKASTGFVEVLMIGENAAVASYTFELSATNVASATVRAGTEEIKTGRATQVFAMDLDGSLRIIHEHLSIAASK